MMSPAQNVSSAYQETDRKQNEDLLHLMYFFFDNKLFVLMLKTIKLLKLWAPN